MIITKTTTTNYNKNNERMQLGSSLELFSQTIFIQYRNESERNRCYSLLLFFHFMLWKQLFLVVCLLTLETTWLSPHLNIPKIAWRRKTSTKRRKIIRNLVHWSLEEIFTLAIRFENCFCNYDYIGLNVSPFLKQTHKKK